MPFAYRGTRGVQHGQPRAERETLAVGPYALVCELYPRVALGRDMSFVPEP